MEILASYDDCVAVAKPSGMLVHNSAWAGPPEPTLLDGVRAVVGGWLAPLHRLDRGTSGVVWFCRRADRYEALHTAMRLDGTRKEYRALVRGHLRFTGVLDHAVPDGEGGRLDARSEIWPIADSQVERVSWVGLRLFTGRRHQARLHLKHLSHPVIGDANYGKGAINRDIAARYGLSRLALHAALSRFTDPVSGHTFEAVAPLPDDLREPLATLVPNAEVWPPACGAPHLETS